MQYLLDTNICVHFLRGRFSLKAKLEAVGVDVCAISEITLAELVFGAENSNDPEKNHNLVNRFSELVSVLPIHYSIGRYGREKARLRRSGMMIGDFDLLIGCTAIDHGLVMVTENIGEFSRIEGIRIENWVVRD